MSDIEVLIVGGGYEGRRRRLGVVEEADGGGLSEEKRGLTSWALWKV
jgi:hypothetical protein